MPAEIIMPKVGDAMTEGKVVRWYKKAGEAVKKGEPVLEIETDKVNLDLEAEADGTLGQHKAEEGQMVPVGELLATIDGAGAKTEDRGPRTEDKTPQRRGTDKKDSIKTTTGEYAEAIDMKAPRTDRSAPQGKVVQMPEAEGRRRSSPLARKMAREMGVSLDAIAGSGPRGRIIAADVKSAGGGQAPAPVRQPPTPSTGQPRAAVLHETKQVPLTAMRRTIAKRLVESTGPIPHFYLTVDYDAANLVGMRQQMADMSGVKVSLNDFIVRAVALALQQHPNVNASWGDEAITEHGEIHIGIAVATPEGLITPVVRNADQKSVIEISHEVRALAEKARNRKLLPNEYQGSTFTISNLGAWGIEEFTAIINPPNAAILAVGAAEPRPVVINGQVVVRDRMKMTMSCDHRVVDGAAGAEFLKTLRIFIEQPLRLVMKD